MVHDERTAVVGYEQINTKQTNATKQKAESTKRTSKTRKITQKHEKRNYKKQKGENSSYHSGLFVKKTIKHIKKYGVAIKKG